MPEFNSAALNRGGASAENRKKIAKNGTLTLCVRMEAVAAQLDER